MSSAIGAKGTAGLTASEPSSNAARRGLWSRFKAAAVRIEKDFAVLKLSVLGLLGTLIGGYFQSLSAYQDKVSAQAKEDMTYAADTFAATSNTLSTAITLQSLLFYDFVHAASLNAGDDKNALTSKHSQDLYKPYEEAAAGLRENVNVLARKVEIYLDWASNVERDPAVDKSFGDDPISTSYLGAVDFDCDTEQNMPKFDKNDHIIIVKAKNGKSLNIDWYSAKHHVYTIAYCFDVTHKVWMETVRQWASQSSLDQSQIKKFFLDKTDDKLQARLDTQVVRLNAFMSRAMNEIEGIRVKYRPISYFCNLPGASSVLGLFSKYKDKCTPVRLRV